MAKIDIDTLKVILQRNEQDPRKVAGILEDIAEQISGKLPSTKIFGESND